VSVKTQRLVLVCLMIAAFIAAAAFLGEGPIGPI
jgi:hypothetical protein